MPRSRVAPTAADDRPLRGSPHVTVTPPHGSPTDAGTRTAQPSDVTWTTAPGKPSTVTAFEARAVELGPHRVTPIDTTAPGTTTCCARRDPVTARTSAREPSSATFSADKGAMPTA